MQNVNRILIVNDDGQIREIIGEMLKSFGYEYEMA